MEYSEKFKDPRWQKVRLKIFERDDFTCQNCGAKGKTLSVHHKYYEYGMDPWDYPERSLVTLCPECHKSADLLRKSLRRELACSGKEDLIFGILGGYKLKEEGVAFTPDNFEQFEGMLSVLCSKQLAHSGIDRFINAFHKRGKNPIDIREYNKIFEFVQDSIERDRIKGGIKK